MRYSYRGFAIVTKVRLAASVQTDGGKLVYQVVRLSDGKKLGTYRTFHEAQAAVDCATQQAA